MSLRCLFGLHKYKGNFDIKKNKNRSILEFQRKCKYCGKTQEKCYDSLYGETYWETIESMSIKKRILIIKENLKRIIDNEFNTYILWLLGIAIVSFQIGFIMKEELVISEWIITMIITDIFLIAITPLVFEDIRREYRKEKRVIGR